MRFIKMQGLGNDYVYVDCFEEKVEKPEKAARIICDRHFGVGADGLILICPSERADCRMEMYNADGSRGAMCGNGIRCVAKYVFEAGLVKKTAMEVETDSGIRKVSCHVRGGRVAWADVEMGVPTVGKKESLCLGGGERVFIPVRLGNSHAVFFCSDVDSLNLEELGRGLKESGRFPDGINAEFVKPGGGGLKMRVWERGAGETLACGTGACAACAAAMSEGILKRRALVRLPGGLLKVAWPGETAPMYLSGPAREVYRGEIAL